MNKKQKYALTSILCCYIVILKKMKNWLLHYESIFIFEYRWIIRTEIWRYIFILKVFLFNQKWTIFARIWTIFQKMVLCYKLQIWRPLCHSKARFTTEKFTAIQRPDLQQKNSLPFKGPTYNRTIHCHSKARLTTDYYTIKGQLSF